MWVKRPVARSVCRCRHAGWSRQPRRPDLRRIARGHCTRTKPGNLGSVARAVRRAGLPATPVPHYVPSAVVNAFATGSKQEASIALTDGLLRSLSPRELAGVLAHEIAHIASEDLRVMGLADSVSRFTSLLALMGQIAILLSLPALLVGAAEVYWPGLLLLAASPQLALLAQLGLSRVREFDADRLAAELTGDPQGLASALAKIEQVSRSCRAWLWPGWGNPEALLVAHASGHARTHLTPTDVGAWASISVAIPRAPFLAGIRCDAAPAALAPERAVALIAYQQETSHGLPRPVPTSRAGPLRPALALHHRLYCRAHAAVAVPARHRGLVQSARGGRSHRDGAWRSGGGRESHHRTVRRIARSVVYITTSQLVRDVWTRNVFSVPRGTGSGFIWDDAGHVVTNFHVIQGASEATVKLADGRDYQAALVGVSPAHDIAVLKIGVVQAPAAVPVGTSADLMGQKVFAIGNPFGLDWTLTTGIVSALDRSLPGEAGGPAIDHLIQTDAAINPGNSGGPLLDSAGRLIGINTAIYSPSGASAGIGFAVPVDTVMRVVPQLIKTGKYIRPALGIEVDEQLNQRLLALTGSKGVFVLRVTPGSAAHKAGLAGVEVTPQGIVPGDRIIGVDGEATDDVAKLLARLDARKVGDVVVLSVERAGKSREVRVELQPGN